MTRDEAKKLAPIIAAYGEGKVIQARFRDAGDVFTDQSGDLSFSKTSVEYRIKPEPREFWACINDSHSPDGWLYKNKPNTSYELIRVREIV